MKYAVSFIVSVIFFIFAMENIVEIKLNFKKISTYFFIALAIILYIINYEYSLPVIRVGINTIIFILLARSLFKIATRDSIVLGIFIMILATFSEVIYALLASSILSGYLFSDDSSILVFVNNLGIDIILLILSFRKVVKDLYKNILKSTNNISEKKIAIISLVIVLISNFFSLLLYFSSINVENKFLIPVIGSSLSLICVIVVFIYFRTQSKYLAIYEKYNISIDSIREFEIMIESYRINTHENKNQFKTIRNMSKNKRVTAYIDALLGEQINDDERLLAEAQKIPAGGLRGIIYTKLLVMKEKKIPFELVVDKNITTALTAKIDDYTLTDVCRILGVLLDNSIEEVLPLIDKNIMVEVYEDESDIVITITNNYEGYVDIESINNPGISSKGENHGYGLSLVKKLVKKNKKIQHTSEFFEDNFMQKIRIKV